MVVRKTNTKLYTGNSTNGIIKRVFVPSVNPDRSICVSVAAPDTQSSVDKRD